MRSTGGPPGKPPTSRGSPEGDRGPAALAAAASPPQFRDSDCCRENLRYLFDRASEGVAVHDADGRLLEVNERLCEMLGFSREELLSMSIQDIDLDHRADQIRTILGDFTPGARLALRTRHRRRDGTVLPVEVRLTVADTPRGRRFIGFSSDTSAHDRLTAALAENQQRFRRLFDVHPDAILVVRRQRIALANPAAAQLMNADDAEELVGLFVNELVPTHRANFVDERIQLLRAGRIAPLADDETCCLDGVIKPTETIGIPFTDEAGPATLVILRDVSARRAMENAVLEAADEARRLLAHDLHDDLGQRLTGMALLAEALARSLERERHEQADTASRLRTLATEAVQGARRLAHGLVPRELQDGRLVDALRDLCRQMREYQSTVCRLRIIGDGAATLSSSAATHVFRIAQEATTNARRHGRAQRIFVMLIFDARYVRLVVADDGRGIADKGDDAGIGLQAMAYRAHALRGNIQFQHRPGGGTRVICQFPRGGSIELMQRRA